MNATPTITATNSSSSTITGRAAIEYAESTGAVLRKYADPTEGPRDGLTIEEAEAIAHEDPSLIYVIEQR